MTPCPIFIPLCRKQQVLSFPKWALGIQTHLAMWSQCCQISWAHGAGAVGSLCLRAHFLLHGFLNSRGWFYGPADCSTCGAKRTAQLGKVAGAALEHVDSSADVLRGQEASGEPGECSSHPCACPISLRRAARVLSTATAAGHSSVSPCVLQEPWQRCLRALSEGSGAGQNQAANNAGLVEVS